MKKKLCLLLTMTMTASMLLFGCGSESDSDNDDKEKTESVADNKDDDKDEAEDKSEEKSEEASAEVSEEASAEVSEEASNVISSEAGDYATIEEYFNLPEIKAQYDEVIAAQIAGNSGIFTNIEITANGNDIVTSYYIANDYAELVKANLEGQDLDALCATGKEQMTDECQITPSSFSFYYYNEDGELLAKGTN